MLKGFYTKQEIETNRVDIVKQKLNEMSDQDISDIDNSLDHFLSELNITLPDYEKALSISETGKIVILKRTLKERYVNNYNPEFILAWKANIDIQFCYDGYAVVSYITDYLSKADAGVTKALKKALSDSKGCSNLERVNCMKRAYFTHRQVSASEAIYRLNRAMHLTKSNVESKFLSTGYPENRSQFFTKMGNKNDDMMDDGEEEDMEADDNLDIEDVNYIDIPGREGKFKKVDTIHKKYEQRPKSLNGM